jgi:hypothetical protein
MVRLLVVCALASVVLACGTPCSRLAAGQENANNRGRGCDGSKDSSWSPTKVKSCEDNLPNCSENDLKQIELYTNCLNALPVCSQGQTTSWNVSRIGCATDNFLFKVSLKCATGF